MRVTAVAAALLLVPLAACNVEDIVGNDCRKAIGVAFLDQPIAVRDRMQAISWRESRWTPGVVNSSGHTGCLQLSAKSHAARARRLGYQWSDLRRAWPNAVVAKSIFDDCGFAPWEAPDYGCDPL